ncbi:hypothetical protein ACSBR2_016621 [Camellia fascicularis]
MDGQRSSLSNLVHHLSQTHRSPLARCRSFSFGALELFPAQGETGVVQEIFRLDSEKRREYTGRLESVCQIDFCSCLFFLSSHI